MWSRLGIRQKVFALFTVIALLPLLIINIIWLRSSRNQLQQAAANHQTVVAASSAQRVDQALEGKTDAIILLAQEPSVADLIIAEARKSLMQFENQDSDIVRMAVADKEGNQLIEVRGGAVNTKSINIKDSEAFKVVSQLSNEASIGKVRFESGQPIMTVAVPLLAFSRVGDQNLTSAEALARRFGADIKGVLIVDIDISTIVQPVLSSELGIGGYAYVVDGTGRLIAHRDKSLLTENSDLSKVTQVSRYLKQPGVPGTPAVSVSEKNVEVMSTYAPVKRTDWAVIAQEPLDSIYAPANNVTRLAVLIFLIAGLASMLLSLLFSRNLTRPIRQLVTGTSQLGQGNFDMHIGVSSNDEIGVLARRFNIMAGDLKKLISSLQTETTKLNVVLDNVGEGIVATDSENRILLANISAAVLAGTLPSDIIGKPFESVFPFSKNNQSFELKMDSVEVYKVFKDVVFISPSKRLHYLEIYTNRMKDDPSDIEYIITLRDQTDERELEMMKLDFVSMAAHELRTPITAIRGYLGLLASDEASKLSAQSEQSIERAQSSAAQLVGLVSNLLNVTKIERGTLNMNLTKIDWAKEVQDALHDHEFNADEKGVLLSYEGPRHEIPLLADEIAIREVINNLIANAINYTGHGGHVTVGVREDDGKVITFVRDDGVGIPQNALQRLFTKFYRVRGGIASGSGGTGLGLYISKSIVDLHKGTIAVESKEGEGSTFTVTLPAFDELQYEEIASKQTKGITKRRGWVTKNTTR